MVEDIEQLSSKLQAERLVEREDPTNCRVPLEGVEAA
jgi:hypothetical protein